MSRIILGASVLCMGLVMAGVAVTQPLASVARAAGDWQQIDYEGIQNWDNWQCSVATLIERRMGFQQAPDGAGYGTYVNFTHRLWLLNRNRTCVIPGQPRNEPFLRGRFWTLRVVPADGLLSAAGAFVKCQGTGCDEAGLFKGDFETRLRQDADRLTDIEGNSPAPIVYLPFQLADRRARQAGTQLLALLAPLTRGNCNQFFNESMDPEARQRGSQEQFCEIDRRIRQLSQPPSEERVGQAFLLGRFVGVIRPVKLNGALIQTELVYPDGSITMRTTILREQPSGDWKIMETYRH